MKRVQQKPLIRHISDTARWAAVYRADENERKDALFRDPYARRLAGERGRQIAQALPFHGKNSWSWVTRTWLFDYFIQQQLEQGVDLVLNLAAGLDARPYRMKLPSSLQWVEVDLGEIFDYKEEILGGENPACRLQRIRLDLADRKARNQLFAAVGKQAQKVLVISEGLLIYLSEAEVAELAQDLARSPVFERWVFDVVSPGLLRMLQKGTHPQFAEGVTPLKFAPAKGPEFFRTHGWQPLEVRSMLKTAAGLKRLSPLFRIFALLPESSTRMGSRPWSGVCLFSRRLVAV